jgi:hypothetical protein
MIGVARSVHDFFWSDWMPTSLPSRCRIQTQSGGRDLIAVASFSTVGLLLTILFEVYILLRFPDLGALIEQYNQF